MKKLFLIITMILTLGVSGVYALESNVTSISIKEKSESIIVDEPSITDNSIDSRIVFKNVGDYVTFTLGLDIDTSLYTIKSVTDNNESEHIKTTYEINEDKIEMKLEYESALTTNMDLDDITITINLKDAEGNTETVVINPGTKDNIIKYITILGVSVFTISGLVLLRKKKNVLGIILLIAIIPKMVIAEEQTNLSISMGVDDIKVGYDVVFNGGEGTTGETETKLCYFGEECKLTTNTFEKENSNFIGWATEIDGEVVYLDEEEVENLASEGKVNLYAMWKNIVCKPATSLHTATCEKATYGCGATVGNGNTITYGTLVNGTRKAGDAYDCDVNNDGTYDSATERFYYVTSDGDNSVLIYYANMNDQTMYAYDSSRENWHGPRTAYQYLPTATEWSNPGLIAPGTRQIVNENGETTTMKGNNTIESFTYTDKVARFLTFQEVTSACGPAVGSDTIGELDNCTWLMENVGNYEIDSGTFTYGYWLENPRFDYQYYDAWYVYGSYRYVGNLQYSSATDRSVRPVITVKTSDIEQ